jgi:GNAT superfamily N-acetyltransferase
MPTGRRLATGPIRRLVKTDDRTQFDCGVDALTRYLRAQAGQDARRSVATVYVLPGLEPPHAPRVIGYYTVSATAVLLSGIAADIAKKLPRYPLVPGFLIGRFAVDTEFQGQGHGARLFHDALRRCATLSREIAAAFIVVDAKNAKLAAWYAGFGFAPTVDAPLKLILPIATVRGALH